MIFFSSKLPFSFFCCRWGNLQLLIISIWDWCKSPQFFRVWFVASGTCLFFHPIFFPHISSRKFQLFQFWEFLRGFQPRSSSPDFFHQICHFWQSQISKRPRPWCPVFTEVCSTWIHPCQYYWPRSWTQRQTSSPSCSCSEPVFSFGWLLALSQLWCPAWTAP